MANQAFHFSYIEKSNRLSKTKEAKGGLHVNEMMRDYDNNQVKNYVNNAESMWFTCMMTSPQEPRRPDFKIEKSFYIAFFDDHYFVNGILNKNFVYGNYPSENERQQIVSQFKKDVLTEIKEKM